MVTELKTEQLAVTALGGEITPALLAPGPGLRREKSGETETKRCKYLFKAAKMLALNSKSDQGLF